MIAFIDGLLRRVLPIACALLLAAMVAFTLYTVVMRSVFDDPPFWGDTLTLFANIWLVMLAFALSIRERRSIAMTMLYDYVPARFALMLELVWGALFVLLGLLMAIGGWIVMERIPGAYWELGNLPKSYPIAILPLAGVLVALAALRVFAEDLARLRRGEGIAPRESTEVV